MKAGIIGTWRDGSMVTGKPAILQKFVVDGGWIGLQLILGFARILK